MKNILIAVSGLTPQVVSETFFCLAVQRNISIDEIFIITTSEGKKNLKEYYFNNRSTGKKEGPYNLKNEISKLCEKYKLSPPSFEINNKYVIVASEENIKMSDVRTDKDNILFPNVITNFIREISSQKNNTLYCSLSGGRKTMSAYMGFALSIYAREHDKLFHVLASDAFEKSGKFYPDSKKTKDLTLSEVPFLKLSPVLINNKFDITKQTYAEIIEQSQKVLENFLDDILFIDLSNRKLIYKDKSVRVQPIHLAIYVYFVVTKEKNPGSIDIKTFKNKEIAQKVFDIYLKLIRKTKEEYEGTFIKSELGSKWWNTGIDIPTYRQYVSKINSVIEEFLADESGIAEEFKISHTGPYASSENGIFADYNKFRII